MKEVVVDALISYLRARGIAEESRDEYSADASMLLKAADVMTEQREEVRVLRERNIRLQRQVGEYEARDMEGTA
jgi:hypothetical protein